MQRLNNTPLRTRVLLGLRTGLLTTLALAAICTVAKAVLLPAPGGVALFGTTVADRPELAGVVIEDRIIPFSYDDGAGNVLKGTLQNRVVRESAGNLTFYYRLKNSAESTLPITGLATIRFSRPAVAFFCVTDADYRLDGLGAIGPGEATRNAIGTRVVFHFAARPIWPGEESRFFFVRTPYCRNYDRLGRSRVYSGAIYSPMKTFEPAP